MLWRNSADRKLVSAIVQTFGGDAERSYALLSSISPRAWEKTTYWLDSSGLALYFLVQVDRLGLEDAVPAATLERLRASLQRNRQRTEALFEEFVTLNTAFQKAGVVYANHKGFTLSPDSCPTPELRHQSDFDFLVAEKSLAAARVCLETRGYTLSAATRKTLEFKRGNHLGRGGWDNYAATPYSSVELHFATDSSTLASHRRMERLTQWNSRGLSFPALSPADQWIAQALHIFGHLRGENTRPSWLLEFRQHAISRRNDAVFWFDVRRLAMQIPYAPMALGASILLATKLFGPFAPWQIETWVLESTPPTVRLWLERYGIRVVLADFPGTKLFLFLEHELETEESREHVALKTRLLPLRRVPKTFQPAPNESFADAVRRRLVRCKFVLFRIRFHLTQALTCALEAPRWRLAVHRVGKKPGSPSAREMTTRKQLHDKLRILSP